MTSAERGARVAETGSLLPRSRTGSTSTSGVGTASVAGGTTVASIAPENETVEEEKVGEDVA